MDRGMGYPSQFILTSHTQNLTLSAYPYWPGMRAAGNLCRVARGRPGKKEKKKTKIQFTSFLTYNNMLYGKSPAVHY